MSEQFTSATLSDVARLQAGINVPAGAMGHGLPYVTVQDLYAGVSIPQETLRLAAIPKRQVEKYTLADGDVLLGKSSVKLDGIGYPSQYRHRNRTVVFSGFTLRAQAYTAHLDSRYLFYWLRLPTTRLWVIGHSQHSALTNLNLTIIRKIPVSFPPLPQQRKIAKILTTVDNLIEKTEALIAKYQAIKQGMMHDLFTRGVDEHGHLRPPYHEAPELYKESELGWIPKEWGVKMLASVSVGGPKNGYFKKPEFVGSGYKLVNVTDLYQPYGIDTDHPAVERVEATEADFQKYGVAEGDLFFTRSSLVLTGIAYCNIVRNVKEPTLFECHVIRIRPNTELMVPDFLALFAQTHVARCFFMAQAKQVTMTTVSQPDICKLLVPVPPKREQHRITTSILSVETKWRQESTYARKLKGEKTGLMQDLLSGKVRVKVDGEAKDV